MDGKQVRLAVKALLERFDVINAQRLAYPRAVRKLLQESQARDVEKLAEQLIDTEFKSMIADAHKDLYAALDDEHGDWPTLLLATLNQPPRVNVGTKRK